MGDFDLEFSVGEEVYYRESGALVRVKVLDRSLEGAGCYSYRLKLEEVFVTAGPGFEESNVGDEWEVSGSGEMGGVFSMYKEKDMPSRWRDLIEQYRRKSAALRN